MGNGTRAEAGGAGSRALAVWLGVAAVASGCASLPGFFTGGDAGDGKVVQAPGSTCVYLAPENAVPPLSACERPKTYEVRAGGAALAWQKALFRRAFRDRLLSFLRGTAYPWPTLERASVEFWLSAPVFAPEAAEFVAVVLGPGGNFAVHLPLDPASWRPGAAGPVTWLGRDPYPSLKARRVDAVVVAPLPLIAPARLRSFVAASGALDERTPTGELAVRAVHGDGTLLELATAPFAERAVAERLRRAADAGQVLASVRYVRSGESEGYKARVFQFAFKEP